jgi:dCTP deaminase
MTVYSDTWIEAKSDPEANDKPLIYPFVKQEYSKQQGLVSYGCGAAGYDVRLAEEGLTLVGRGLRRGIMPGDERGRPVPEQQIEELPGGRKVLWVEPGQLIRARSVEQFNIPRDVVMTPYGKSTYTRSSLTVNATIGDPGWGRKPDSKLVGAYYTFSISNPTNTPLGVFLNEGIMQMQFSPVEGEVAVSYDEKGGKYHGATGVEAPKLTDATGVAYSPPTAAKPLSKRQQAAAEKEQAKLSSDAEAIKIKESEAAAAEEFAKRSANAGNN